MTEANAAPIVVGTRGSALARSQTHSILRVLRAAVPDRLFSVRVVETVGDRRQDLPIASLGDKGLFVRALEQSLLRGDIDLAVHSLKDVPGDMEQPRLTLCAYSVREDARDVLISRTGHRLSELPQGARVGTGSLRRRAQLHMLRADLRVVPIRGNVDSRLVKLDRGEFDAIILAAAGLIRLNLADRITEYLPVEQMVPDAGQGIVVVQARHGVPAMKVAQLIDNLESRTVALAEREVVRALNATCRSPVGAYVRLLNDKMRLLAMAAPEDCSSAHWVEEVGPRDQAGTCARSAAARLSVALAGEGSAPRS